ncbi:hypothetical protein VTG60DRAFT_1428 [Thermothelomyces hinnuleus]
MLHPARRRVWFENSRGQQPRAVLVRDFNWDWAAVPCPGRRRRNRRHQFWSLDRWPAPSSKEDDDDDDSGGRRRSNQDRFADGAATYDPAAADPTTDRRYTQPRMRPYGYERVLFRPGPAVYQAGDTRLQREVLRGLIEDMADQGEFFLALPFSFLHL